MTQKPNNDFSLLLASSVHDMKNSLGMLLSSLEDMLDDYPPQTNEHRKCYTTLQSEASRIRNDLIYLLGIYRLQRDELPIQVEEIFLTDFLQQQVAQNSVLFDIRELSLILECDDDLAAYFDEELISGVMNNVLVNAAKYTRTKITISAMLEDGNLVIRVMDDGDGYPSAMLVNPGAKLKGIDFGSGSTSLGLQFAAQIAALHQRHGESGYIRVENLPSGGGCFSLYLP
jgi:signal transduction histidine kinase